MNPLRRAFTLWTRPLPVTVEQSATEGVLNIRTRATHVLPAPLELAGCMMQSTQFSGFGILTLNSAPWESYHMERRNS